MRKLLIYIIIFLLIGAYIIQTAYNLDIKDKQDQKTFFKIFSGWMAKLYDNLKQITAMIINQEWVPETNKTND